MLHDANILHTIRQELALGSFEPVRSVVDSAAADIPVVLQQMEPLRVSDDNVQIHTARQLTFTLGCRGHAPAPAAWAVYRLIERGFLDARLEQIDVPVADTPSSTTSVRVQEMGEEARPAISEAPALYIVPAPREHDPVTDESASDANGDSGAERTDPLHSLRYLVIWPLPGLWKWWEAQPGGALHGEPNGPVQSLFDSPKEGDFRWNGRTHRFSGLSWRLLSCLWNRQQMDYGELTESVWEKPGVKESTLRSAVSRLNDRLAELGIDLSWRVSDRYVIRD